MVDVWAATSRPSPDRERPVTESAPRLAQRWCSGCAHEPDERRPWTAFARTARPRRSGWATWAGPSGTSIPGRPSGPTRSTSIFGRDPDEGPIHLPELAEPRRARRPGGARPAACGRVVQGDESGAGRVPHPPRRRDAQPARRARAAVATGGADGRARSDPGHHRPPPGRAHHVGVAPPAAGGPRAGGRGAPRDAWPCARRSCPSPVAASTCRAPGSRSATCRPRRRPSLGGDWYEAARAARRPGAAGHRRRVRTRPARDRPDGPAPARPASA